MSKFEQILPGMADAPFARWPTIRDDPRFLPAIAEAAGGMAAVHERHRAMKHLANDRGRLAVAVAGCVLDPDISVAGILRMVPAAYIGRARVLSFLRLLERAGHLVRQPDGPDRRLRRYRLGDSVKAAVTDYVEAILRPALPFASHPPADPRDPALVRYCIVTSSMLRMRGHELFEASPILRQMSDLKGGNVLLLELFRGAHDPGQPPDVRRATLARRFDLSRTHVIDLVRLGRREGWLTGPPGTERPSEGMIEQGRLYFARHFALASLLLDGFAAQAKAGS